MKFGSSLFLLLAGTICANAGHAPSEYAFEARSISGESVLLNADADRLVVVAFLGAECPMARIYGPRLQQLQLQFGTDRLRVIGINSNIQDSFADVKAYVQELQVDYEFVRDIGSVIADQFGAQRTPEVFLLNSDLTLLYRGRIDDQYAPGINRAKPDREDLKLAIQQTLDGQTVSVPVTSATGCVIGRGKSKRDRPVVSNNITYSEHVVPVLTAHCLECHRSGEIGPFAMSDYGEVSGWAETMLEVIDNGRMPPWHADPAVGKFHNARVMPEKDKAVIRNWVAGGMKPGDRAAGDAILAEAALQTTPSTSSNDEVTIPDGWQLPETPDVIVPMRNRPFVVPADGVVEYQYFVADPGNTEDRWIRGAQVLPGNRSVVHHAIVFIRPPDGTGTQGIGLLSGYVPGQKLVPLPPGCARRLPAGSRLVFQMHYTPNGRQQEDTTKVGLVYADEQDVTDEVYSLIALDQEFEIPPNSARHTVDADLRWSPENGRLLSVAPHMHYRGKSFRLITADGEELLSVPTYDFNWQHTYAFHKPLHFKDLGRLKIEATFDNSQANPFNPNPDEWVMWGDQTWEEMAVAFFEIAEPRQQRPDKSQTTIAESQTDSRIKSKIAAYVERALTAMDANADDRISKSECSVVVRHFNFHRFDLNDDGVATREELETVARTIFSAPE